MLFNSLSFLFLFLPICLLCYYGAPHRFRNVVLLLFSLVFFAWGGVKYTLLLIGSMLLNYVGALLIDNGKTPQRRKAFLFLILFLNICLLVWFKYAGFLAVNLNGLISYAGLQSLSVPEIALPIGISFYTFHGVSYIADVYRNVTPVQKSPVRMALYISLFPQLIAGPIIRYSQIAGQLNLRRFSYGLFSKGLQRFLIGLGKKVIIANNLALATDTLWGVEFSDMSCSTAWLGIICYTLQIYTDFSAYSDMAIGLAALFGFEFPENFNFPYTATSMKDFWSRWHISLSSWFRDYVYIPLGGNRNGIGKTYRNLLLVFILTGFWHGSSWNFLFWGLFHGAFLMLERGRFGTFLERWPKGLRHAYTLLLILLSWVPFRASDLHSAFQFYRRLFDFTPFTAHKYNEYIQASLLNRELLLVLLITVLGSTGFFAFTARRLEMMKGIVAYAWQSMALAGFLIIFWWSVALIMAGSYSPFIYFRF
jgi:alginate O-acetyltransferase complex protein AlgI